MTTEWKHVRSVLDRALDLEPEERAAWLAARREEDPALVDEVEALLAADQDSGTLDPLFEGGLDDPTALAPLEPGTRLGSYCIQEVLASGGMGAVYRAERADSEFDKQVAIKVLKPGMDSAQVLRGFRHERQVLADLEHPGIARLLDGGATPEGRPFLVMELVQGEAIDAYCDRTDATLEQRIALFRQVCEAVHHAHQRLVIHRDLKPSNILVTAEGHPKLLDFGIAKVLAPEAEDGAERNPADLGFLTPAYASPEHLRGQRVTTASDVYSLGVVLYALLTGRTPHDLTHTSSEEMRRIVSEEAPVPPSERVRGTSRAALARRLEGDLDSVVLKALHKQPEQRYASPEQLAADLDRHLRGLPVVARPDTFGYRASRFLKRNRTAASIAALLVVALVTGVVVSTRLYLEASAANEDAQRRFDDVRELAQTIIFEISQDLQGIPGATRARERIVSAGLDYLDRLAADSRSDDALQLEVASAFLEIADVQGGLQTDNLGRAADARASYDRAHAILERLADTAPELEGLTVLRARSAIRRGDLAVKDGDTEGALAFHRRALELLEGVPAEAAFKDRQDAHERMAQQSIRVRDLAGAREHRQAVLDAATALGPGASGLHLAAAQVAMAELEAYDGDFEESERLSRVAIAKLEQLTADGPGDEPTHKLLGKALNELGRVLAFLERSEEQLEVAEQALAEFRWLSEHDTGNVQALRNLAIQLQAYGYALGSAERREEALDALRESLELRQRLAAMDPGNAERKRSVALAHRGLAEALGNLDRLDEALESIRLARELTRTCMEADPNNAVFEVDLILCQGITGVAYQRRSEDEQLTLGERLDALDEAEAWFSKAAARAQEMKDAGRMARSHEFLIEKLAEDLDELEQIRAALDGD